MIKNMEKAFTNMPMVRSLKVSIDSERSRVMDSINIKVEIFMKVIIRRMKSMEKESIGS